MESLLRALVVVLLLLPGFYWDGGVIEREATDFVRQYTDGRSLAQKLFDPHLNDYGAYQARELSYVLDLVDGYWVMWLLSNGILLFVPLTGIVTGLATIAAFEVGVRRTMPALSPLLIPLLLLLYFSNYVSISTLGVLYRSAKPALAAVMLATALYLLYACNRPATPPGRRYSVADCLAVFSGGCVMALLDRQGFFYLGVFCACLGLYRLRTGRGDELLLGALAALVSVVVYTLVIGPAAIQAVTSKPPDFSWQEVPLGQFIDHPEYLLNAVSLLGEAISLVMGGLPAWLCLATGLVMLLDRYGRHRRAGLRAVPTDLVWTIAALVTASSAVMWAVLLLRHPPVFEWADHHLWYYPLPFQALFLVGLTWVLSRTPTVLRAGRGMVVPLVLAGMVTANVAGWPAHRSMMMSGPWFPYVYRESSIIKHGLRNGEVQPQLDEPFGRFYEYIRPGFARPSVPRNSREVAPIGP